MRKRQTVCLHVESVESRVVLSVIGLHAHSADAIAAHVSQERARDAALRANLAAIDHARRIHQRARLLIDIAHPERASSTSTSGSSSTSAGLGGVFKSFLSAF